LKVKTIDYPNGICASVSIHSPGSSHLFTIFKSIVKKYKNYLLKTNEEKVEKDEIPPVNTYADQWTLISDSSFHSAGQFLRAILVKKMSYERFRT
jgi:hypothetical protein